MEKLVLIDGNSLFNRAYYATPIFTTKSGNPTNAIFGFVKLMLKIINEVKPKYMVVAFDMKAPTFRHDMYDGYKSTRKPMPDDLAAQMEPLKGLLKAMGIAIYGKAGIEADDIIGTLSAKFEAHSLIYTGDRDSYQLVDKKTDVCFTKKGVSDVLHLTAENFVAETGLNPCQIVDLKALMGDKSDNIPGVPGIGEKTARDLIVAYGSLDGVYERVDELKGAVRLKLTENRKLAYLSYKLAKIDRDCEVDLKLEDCSVPEKFGAEVKKMFEEFEFKSLLSLDIFDGDGASAPSVEIIYPEKLSVISYEEFEPVLNANNRFSIVFSDEEAEIYTGDKEYSLKIGKNLLTDNAITANDFVKVLKAVFENPENTVIAFDFKNDLHALDKLGIAVKCNFDDLELVKYLCDYSSSFTTLKQICEYYMYDLEFPAFALSELFDKFYEKLIESGMLSLYGDVEKPLLVVLFEMETEGVRVSVDRLEELSNHYQTLIDEYRTKIFEQCGETFNINSPMQLGQVLYEKMGIQSVKKKKTGKFSTSAEVLEKLTEKFPVVADVLKFRLYQKLFSTYIEGFRPLIDRKNNLIHTTFRQTGTTTGRLSSLNPNLQNIPIREDEGRELRKMFVPREGNVFIDADYSQIELRLLAHFSGCKELVEAYNSGTDIHAITASQVFGVDIADVTPKMRREAKAVNFGIIYGISDFGLSKNLNIPLVTAREYIERYFATYSAVKDYMNKNVEFAREHGYVATLTGRKRVIPEINSTNYNLRQFGERASMNMPLQGSSADIIKIAMINVRKALKDGGLKAKLILQVHDELVLEAPESEVQAASEILKREMENAVKLSVPLTVDVHTGKNWYDAK